MIGFASEEDGQAIVIVGLAMVVLIGATALSVDWGYSFLTRRGAQNEADAAVLAAGRMLASSYVGGASPFAASQEQTWCEAARQRDANGHSAPTALSSRTLSISFSADGTAWTPITNVGDCSSPATTTPIPTGTTLVRASAGATYASLFGAATGQALTVQASARVQLARAGIPTGSPDGVGVYQLRIPSAEVPGTGLSGATTTPNVAIWPIALHVQASDFTSGPCGQFCDTRSHTPITLSDTYRTFTGLITFAHFSPRSLPAVVHQLETESDYTGTTNGEHGHPRTALLTNADSRACGGAPSWDTNGLRTDLGSTSANLAYATSCDLPNWFRYGFRGSLSLSTDWGNASWSTYESSPGNADLPDPLDTSRSTCASLAALSFPAPSCAGSNHMGDWVETAPGTITALMGDQMRAFIDTYGRDAHNPAIPGRAVVVHVFLWDCAEHFDASQPLGSQWDLMVPGRGGDPDDSPDCSQLKRTDTRVTSVDRIHLVSVVPMTIYRSLVTTSGGLTTVQAYWGNVFGGAGGCGVQPLPAGCALSPLINTAYLIADE